MSSIRGTYHFGLLFLSGFGLAQNLIVLIVSAIGQSRKRFGQADGCSKLSLALLPQNSEAAWRAIFSGGQFETTCFSGMLLGGAFKNAKMEYKKEEASQKPAPSDARTVRRVFAEKRQEALSGQPLCSQVAKGCADKLQKLCPV